MPVIASLWLFLALLPAISAQPINRHALVTRHNPVLRHADPWSPFTLGNGEFAFTADITGLQTFPAFYRESIPLATLSQWAWHSFPNPDRHRLEQTFENYDTAGRPVPHPTNIRTPAAEWLRQNPHRLGLARIGFVLEHDGRPAAIAELEDVEQRLDLWTGILDSRFRHQGEQYQVRTCVHPSLDLLAVRVTRAGASGRPIAIRIEFPCGSGVHTGEPAAWDSPEKHHTRILAQTGAALSLERRLDADRYFVRLQGAAAGSPRRKGRHEWVLEFPGNEAEFLVHFSGKSARVPVRSFAVTEKAAQIYWRNFWQSGGAMDLSRSTDPRARELERRIVLSRYLTAVHCSGSTPPQETGLAFNSWYGKFHLEMHWWHAAHFPLWGHPEMLEKSLAWYRRIAPLAAMTAARVGEPSLAIRFLLMDTPKNRYLPNGHNYQRPGLTIYLPGNGGLLAAAAMMAAGWDGAPDRHAPGFPDDGKCTVQWEGFHPLP